MRITAKTKVETRERILKAAKKLFRKGGFDKTTTRDIAGAAGIATGTLFNYFPTKESLAIQFVSEAMNEAEDQFRTHLRGDELLEESLFAHVAQSLRLLRPHRGYIGDVLETTLSPFAQNSDAKAGAQIRVRHLETVRELIMARALTDVAEPSVVTMHLYWTLFLGVLSFWAKDDSPNQEDTLVLLDQSLHLFTGSLNTNTCVEDASHDA